MAFPSQAAQMMTHYLRTGANSTEKKSNNRELHDAGGYLDNFDG